jgi:hypothetical protein
VHDTVRSGDTFGSILNTQNLGEHQVYDIVDKVKDGFDVRTIRIGNPTPSSVLKGAIKNSKRLFTNPIAAVTT